MQIIEKTKSDAIYETVKAALKHITDIFVVFDISALLNGGEVQPNGMVKVTFNIPKGFSNNLAIYFVADDGTKELIKSETDKESGTITAELSHFSSYVICDLTEKVSKPTDTKTPAAQNSSNLLIYIIIVVAAVSVVSVVVAVIIIKKKKSIVAK